MASLRYSTTNAELIVLIGYREREGGGGVLQLEKGYQQ